MIEIPESTTISRQAQTVMTGKTVKKVINATYQHRFTWYNGDSEKYPALLTGKQIKTINGYGSFIDIGFTDDMHLAINDGTNLRYNQAVNQFPEKFQLLILLNDDSFLTFTVAMYGGIFAFKKDFDNIYYQGSIEKLSPVSDDFNAHYFDNLINQSKPNLSMKAFLATEQRIPGLGNGVVQDILFNAHLHPKRKLSAIGDKEKENLFYSLKTTLVDMISKNGRDTEKDIYGNQGGYKTILSKNTGSHPCPQCGSPIIKEAYLGGSIYYCPVCQKMK